MAFGTFVSVVTLFTALEQKMHCMTNSSSTLVKIAVPLLMIFQAVPLNLSPFINVLVA